MKIPDYNIGTTFDITCTKKINKDGKVSYTNFGILQKFAHIWGCKPEDVITVKMKIIEINVCIKDLFQGKTYDLNSIDYFGKINIDDEIDISCIYPNVKLYMVCFPYGPDVDDYWDFDVYDPLTQKLKYNKGDRKSMNVRLKIEEC